MFAGGGHPERLRAGASGQAKGSCPLLLAEMLVFAFLSAVLEGRPTRRGSASLASGDCVLRVRSVEFAAASLEVQGLRGAGVFCP